MKNKNKIIGIAAVAVVVAAVAVVLALIFGGSEGKAAGMWLVKTQGTVAVTDSEGSDVPLRNLAGVDMRLGLFDGYSVGTEYASYGWINLDDVKLTKLDEDSEVEIKKSGKKLELDLSRGSIFFNVTKPLEDDETLEIRSSTMVMAIRGTSGWVRADGETMDVYIIEGEVKCTARVQGNLTPATESVKAGERARMSITGGEAAISVEEYDISDVPDFVAEEARSDEKVAEDFAGIGIDFGGDPDGGDGPGGSGGTNLWNRRERAQGELGDVRGDPDSVSWALNHLYPSKEYNTSQVRSYLPVVYGDAPGIDAINDFFADMEWDYLDRMSDIDARFDAGLDPVSFVDYIGSEVCGVFDGKFSVHVFNMVSDGTGHVNQKDVGYVFDLETGRLLKLTDVLDGTEEEIKDAIDMEIRRTLYEDTGLLNRDSLDLDTLSFYINPNAIDSYYGASQMTFVDSGTENWIAGAWVYIPSEYLSKTEEWDNWVAVLPIDWPVSVYAKGVSIGSIGGLGDSTTEEVTGLGSEDVTTTIVYELYDSDAPGMGRINAAIDEVANEFARDPDYYRIMESAEDNPYDGHYYFRVSIVTASGNNDEFTSFLGNKYVDEPTSAGATRHTNTAYGYTFFTQTGERAKLSDFVNGSDEDILKFIAQQLIDRRHFVGEEYRQRIMDLDVDDLMFYTSCGANTGLVYVPFNFTDIGAEPLRESDRTTEYVYNSVLITIPGELRD